MRRLPSPAFQDDEGAAFADSAERPASDALPLEAIDRLLEPFGLEVAVYGFDERLVRIEPRRHVDQRQNAKETPLVVLLDTRDIAILDRAITLANVLATHFSSDMADDVWNLRNAILPFQPGDEHHIPEE